MSESAARFCIVPQFKIVDGRKGEESVKDEVGRGTAGGPDEPIAPAAVQRQLSGRRRPIMIDQLSAAAARLPGREGERREGGWEGVGGGGREGKGSSSWGRAAWTGRSLRNSATQSGRRRPIIDQLLTVLLPGREG